MKRWLHRLGPFVSLLLFALALWLLRRELAAFRYQDVVAYLQTLPAWRVVLALAATAGGYAALTGYDLLGVRYAGASIPYRRVAVASFIGYSFSNSVGHALLTSTPIRFRLYSAWGASSEQITKIVGFCFLTFWLGFLALAGVAFTFLRGALPAALHLPFGTERPLGVIFLAATVVYLGATALAREPLQLREWRFEVPGPKIGLAQIGVSALDWALAAAALYLLLPAAPGLSYPGFLGIFLLAQMAGFVSQVPGGLGVVETVIVLLLAPWLPAAPVLGALVVYRAIYYLLPLIVAAALLAGHEAAQRRAQLDRAVGLVTRWGPEAVPQALALTTLVGGALLLFSGATPSSASDLAWVGRLLPLPVIELSHFLGSVTGAALLVLARGLQRRLDAAYYLTAALLAVGVAASVAKLDFTSAVTLGVMLVLLLPCRRSFYRQAALARLRFTPGWVATVALVLLAAVWLADFSFQNVDYSSDLWWSFAVNGQAPRSLRALVGAVGLIFVVGAVRLLKPAPPEPEPPSAAELERAQGVARASPRTYAYLALLGDKHLLFHPRSEAFLMYGVEGRSWVSMGDPVGPEEAATELAWRFHETAERHGGWTVFYQVTEATLSRYVDMGLTLLKLGEEGRVSLSDFSLEGGGRKDLRQTVRRAEKEGASFEVLPASEVPGLLPDLERISNAWLAEKNAGEKGFSLGFFEPAYLARLPVAVVRQEGRIVAFANVWPGGGWPESGPEAREELSLDLMRYGADAPPGVMTYLITRLMLWGVEQGYRRFSMGMAPLSGLEERLGAPLWNRVAGLVYRYGEHFYNFQGLRQYKEKFEPEWEARYLAAPGGLALPQILSHVTTLIGGGFQGVIGR